MSMHFQNILKVRSLSLETKIIQDSLQVSSHKGIVHNFEYSMRKDLFYFLIFVSFKTKAK